MNHGHVKPNPDGSVARCGGPAICSECATELAQSQRADKSKQRHLQNEILEIIFKWKFSWMNQTQNSKEDFDNYYRRAFGVDSNMMHDLASKIAKHFEKDTP